MNKTYQSVASALVLAAASFAFVAEPMTAQATVTLVGSATDPSGFDGLVIDGTTYDVAFVGGSYNSVYASVQPTFLGNATGAQDAATALASALTSLAPATEMQTINIFIPDGSIFAGNNTGWDPAHSFGMPFFEGTYSNLDTTTFAGVGTGQIQGYTEFTAVPEPATWALMILGVLGIGFMAYRRRSTTSESKFEMAAFGRLFY